MNILVTGSNGQLGTHMRLLAPRSRHQWFFTDVAELDITSRNDVRSFVDQHSINLVVNCAAYTNVDRAESEESVAYGVNAEAVGYLAEAMKAVDGTLIHVSTDYVFGGNRNNTPCREDEPENPTGAYGRTKMEGERKAQTCRHIILRTAWLYSEYGKNFLLTMLSLTASKPDLKVVFDQVGTPTYAGDLAKAIFDIVEEGSFLNHQGVYHFSNEGVCSWYDFAKTIALLSGHNGCNIQPCHSDEFPSPVKRPAYSVLDKTKYKQTFRREVPYWTDSLARCINNMVKDSK